MPLSARAAFLLAAQRVRGKAVVATQFDHHECSRRFRLYLAILTVSLGIAAVFALQGAWLVLPFAGAEMLVLGGALYIVARRSARWQMITIRDEQVDIVEHGPGSEHQETFQRAWTRVELLVPAIKGHPSRLVIGSHGRRVEIGGCLNEEDKQYLLHELREAVRPTH
jgi:uncharacterized membrane protein